MIICKPRRNYSFLRDPYNGWREIAEGELELIEFAVRQTQKIVILSKA